MMTRIRVARTALLTLGVFVLSACERPAASGAEGAALAEEKGCVACHGLNGKGTAPTFPNLNGQWPAYLHKQLVKYRSGERENAIMAGQAAALADHEIDVLARYYAQQ
jgi:cytochrome c553